MMHKRIEQIDTETGEVIDGCIVWIPHRPKLTEVNKWFMLFQETLLDIAKDKDLALPQKNVLLFMWGHLDFENYIHIKQQEIADELEMHKSGVSRAIKTLVDKKIILLESKQGVRCYRLNPDYGWKGKIKNLNEYRQDIKEKTRSQLQIIQGGKI